MVPPLEQCVAGVVQIAIQNGEEALLFQVTCSTIMNPNFHPIGQNNGEELAVSSVQYNNESENCSHQIGRVPPGRR